MEELFLHRKVMERVTATCNNDGGISTIDEDDGLFIPNRQSRLAAFMAVEI